MVGQKQLRKALLLVLLSVSDYKHLDTSLHFIITNLYTDVLNIFKNIGHSLKHLSSSQKTLHPPGVPSCLEACIHNNERRKGRGRRGPWKNLTFSYQIF